MINHFIPRPNVKDHSIVMFRDDDDPYVFYYMNNLPRVAIDKDSRKPAFDYMVIGRNIDMVASREVQEGRLVMSVNLALTEKEKAAVEKSVKEFVEKPNFVSDVELYYPNYVTTRKTNVSTVAPRSHVVSRFTVRVMGESKQVTIQSVEFNSGKASLNLTSSECRGAFVHEAIPTLSGDCDATFVADLDSKESNILYKILKQREENSDKINLGAVVLYEMKFNTVARFNASASINYGLIYQELQKKRKNRTGGGLLKYYIRDDALYTSKESLREYLCDLDKLNEGIKIKFDLPNGFVDENKKQQLSETLLSQIVDRVIGKLFEKVEPISVGNAETFRVCYELKKDEDDFECCGVTLNAVKKKVVEISVNPNASLEVALSDKNDIDSMVRVFDAGSLYYQELVVPIKVDSTNFGRDIAMVSVRVLYKDKTGAVKKDKIFNFRGENPETKFFEVFMCRDENGLIDRFYYQTRIQYRGFDVYGRDVREEDKWTKEKETQGVGKGIYVPCSAIRNISVCCEAGDVAWDAIQKMEVEFEYKSNPDKDGAKKLIVLTEEKTSDVWNCFMYNETDDSYCYRIHYFYQDGSDDWSEELVGSAIVDKITVNDKLSGLFKIKFDVDINDSIEKIRIIVKYQNKEEEGDWICEDDSWVWQTRLKLDGSKCFQYKYQYYLVNGDDSLQESDWSAPIDMNTECNQQNIVVDVQVNQIKLLVDGYSIDWNVWNKVLIHFRYDDEINNRHYGYNKITPSRLDADNREANVIIPVADSSVMPIFYAEYISLTGITVRSDEAVANMCIVLLSASLPEEGTSTAIGTQMEAIQL